MTRDALVMIAGVGPTTIYEVERGKETVRLQKHLAILGALNVSVYLDSPIMNQYDEQQKG